LQNREAETEKTEMKVTSDMLLLIASFLAINIVLFFHPEAWAARIWILLWTIGILGCLIYLDHKGKKPK
jgi:predicted membrane channel-forming protein YqfA (hemolysin III family)